MRKVTFVNSRGDSVVLSNKSPFILQKIDGLGAPKTTIQTQKAPFQDGSTYLGNNLEDRPINIEGTLFGSDRQETIELRARLAYIFNPKLGPGILRYENGTCLKQIQAKVEEGPDYPSGKENTGATFQKFMIYFLCQNPFWLDDTMQGEEITTWIGGVKFPLKLPTGFATRGPNKKNIINKGDVETPVILTFKGPATNPKIANLTSGEFIKVKRALISTDKLIISTEFGNKYVVIEDGSGNRTNVFNWIDLESAFWQLEPGDNIIEYSSDNQVEPAEVSITYYNRYIGI